VSPDWHWDSALGKSRWKTGWDEVNRPLISPGNANEGDGWQYHARRWAEVPAEQGQTWA
jgi:hypothetical protein